MCKAYARMASTPWARLPSSSCGMLVRHEPNASRRSRSGLNVAIRLGGYGESGGGHTGVAVDLDGVVGAIVPGSRPETAGPGRSGGRAPGTSARSSAGPPGRTPTRARRATSTQIAADVSSTYRSNGPRTSGESGTSYSYRNAQPLRRD